MKWFLLILGGVLVAEGIPYALFPRAVKLFFLRIQNLEEDSMRWIGLFSMLTGLALVFLASR